MLSQFHALPGEAVNVGRPECGVAVASRVPNAQVVGHNEQEVGAARGHAHQEEEQEVEWDRRGHCPRSPGGSA